MLISRKKHLRMIRDSHGRSVKGFSGKFGMIDEYAKWYYASRERKLRSFITFKMYSTKHEMRKQEKIWIRTDGKGLGTRRGSTLKKQTTNESKLTRRLRDQHCSLRNEGAVSIPVYIRRESEQQTGVVQRG